jgi:PAS domain S-box-containing protein
MKIQSEVLLQAVFHSSPIAIAIIAIDDGLIVDVNDSFVRATGFAREEVVGKTTREMGFWKEPEKRDAYIKTLKELRALQERETIFPVKSGEERIFSGASEVFESDGKEFVVTMLRDVTESKRLYESETWRREAAEALQRMTLDIMSSLELDQVLQNVLTYLGQVIAYDSVCLFLLKGEKIYPIVSKGFEDQDEILNAAFESDLIADLQRTRQPIVIADVQTDSRFKPRAATAHIRGWLGVPLLVRGQFIGCLTIDSNRANAYAEPHIALAQRFAAPIAVMIENAQLYDKLYASHHQLKQLHRQLIISQEHERQRISTTLHEDAGQTLVAMQFNLDSIRNALPPELQSLRQQTDELLSMVGALTRQIRLMAHDLRPQALATMGINGVLEDYIYDFAERTGLEIDYQNTGTPPLPDDVSICLYRFLQVALTSIRAHTQASHVQVNLQCPGDYVRLCISENDRTRDAAQLNPLYDEFAQIQQYIELLNGRLDVKISAEHNLRFTAQIPLSDPVQNSPQRA